jgi:RNA polymerase sigma-70 factor, ECF subfamily
MKNEIELIERTRKGDQRAFKHLYDGNVDALYRFMSQFTCDTAQVEDWVQRAFIKAYRNIEKFQHESRFATWLFAIALNEMRSDSRKPSRVITIKEEISETGGNIGEVHDFLWNETMRVWLQELEELKRTVFLLYEIEGYSHAEIASMLNIAENNSRTLLCRAKQILKAKWEEEERFV